MGWLDCAGSIPGLALISKQCPGIPVPRKEETVHEVRESGVKMRNHLPCLNRKLNRCPFCGCGDLNVFVFDGMGMALDYTACVECPSCRGRGPEVVLDPTVLRQDEPTESEVFELKNQACDVWNKALGKCCKYCAFGNDSQIPMICAKTSMDTAQFHVCDKFEPIF